MVVMFNDGGGLCLQWKIKTYKLASLHDYYSKLLSTTLYLYTPIHMYYNAEELNGPI